MAIFCGRLFVLPRTLHAKINETSTKLKSLSETFIYKRYSLRIFVRSNLSSDYSFPVTIFVRSEYETWSLWATAWEIPGFYVGILSRSRNTSDTKGGGSVIVEWPSLDDSSKGARGRRRWWITQIRKHCALGIWREFRRKRKAFPLFRVATAAWPVRATADKTEHRFSLQCS